MISAADLMKRVGVSGKLVPFYKAVCVYFCVGLGGAPSAAAAAVKCAPVLCLLACVLWQRGAAPAPRGRYARLVALGLALSALGDACLVWPAQLAAGMALFGGAHIAYVAAFGARPRAWRAGAACAAAWLAYVWRVRAEGALGVAMPLYGALLAAMAWRGCARAGPQRAGALLFALSDAVLGYSLFAGPVPYKQVVVMSTYYLGQLMIALSALELPAAEHAH